MTCYFTWEGAATPEDLYWPFEYAFCFIRPQKPGYALSARHKIYNLPDRYTGRRGNNVINRRRHPQIGSTCEFRVNNENLRYFIIIHFSVFFIFLLLCHTVYTSNTSELDVPLHHELQKIYTSHIYFSCVVVGDFYLRNLINEDLIFPYILPLKIHRDKFVKGVIQSRENLIDDWENIK